MTRGEKFGDDGRADVPAGAGDEYAHDAEPLRLSDVSYCHQTSTPMSVTVITYAVSMVRWEPDARGRLGQAAFQLFAERGFEQVTVAEIAERAGLTERTFLRYFADKREVLFAGAGGFQDLFASTAARAPAPAAPIDAVTGALYAAAAMFTAHEDGVRRRSAIIAAHPDLRER